MFFNKNEIIELAGGKKHLVVDTTKLKGNYYYFVCEVNSKETEIVPTFKVITTVSENGNLFIKTIKDDLENELTAIFKENLNLN